MRHRSLFALSITLSFSAMVTAQSAPGRPAITGIAHMTVYAADSAAANKFYAGELGLAPGSPDAAGDARFFVSKTQYVVVAPLPADHTNSRLKAVYFATADAEGLRGYLKAHAVAVPASLTRDPDGTLSFEVKDPEGNAIGFEQAGNDRHIPVTANPTSTRMIHVGFAVRSEAAEDPFYRDLLGFRPYWHGGMKEGVDDWVSQQVPDGSDWLEYMLNVPAGASQRALGGADHFSLGVASIDDAAGRLGAHGWHETPGEHRQAGRDGKMQLNVFDPEGTRAEFMEFSNFREPCCSTFTAANPKP